MNSQEYYKVRMECPKYAPVVRISRLPKWLEGKLKKGDEGFLINGSFNNRWRIGISYLTFVEYRDLREGKIV